MQQYVVDDFEVKALPSKRDRTAFSEKKGHTGNVVPFFPTNWKKNANDVFNLIMNGAQPAEDNFDEETTHAAVYRKAPD